MVVSRGMNDFPSQPLPEDRLVSVRFPGPNLSLVYADATAAARELEERHLSGPAASRSLAEGLVAAALLSVEASEPDEAVSFEMSCDGPVGAIFAEATGSGTLRGYTKSKIINELDNLENPATDAERHGTRGAVRVMRSLPGRILATGQAAVPSPSVAHALAAYHAVSLQRKAAFLVSVRTGPDFKTSSARGLMVERMPDGDVDAFVRVLEIMNAPDAPALLDRAASLRALCNALALPPDGVFTDLRPLAFGCRCSADKVAAVLAALPEADRAALAAAGKPVTVHCHLCGKAWTVPPPAMPAFGANPVL